MSLLLNPVLAKARSKTENAGPLSSKGAGVVCAYRAVCTCPAHKNSDTAHQTSSSAMIRLVTLL